MQTRSVLISNFIWNWVVGDGCPNNITCYVEAMSNSGIKWANLTLEVEITIILWAVALYSAVARIDVRVRLHEMFGGWRTTWQDVVWPAYTLWGGLGQYRNDELTAWEYFCTRRLCLNRKGKTTTSAAPHRKGGLRPLSKEVGWDWGARW